MTPDQIFEQTDRFFEKNDIQGARLFLESQLESAETNSDLPAVLIICNELGGLYRSLELYDKGLSVYAKAEQAIHDLHLTNTENHATTLVNYATLNAVAGNSKDALDMFTRASQIFERCGITGEYRIAALYNNISILYQNLQNWDLALCYLNKALNILESLPDCESEKATSYTNMAQIFLNGGDLEKAESFCGKALEMFENCTDENDIHYQAAKNTQLQIRESKKEA